MTTFDDFEFCFDGNVLFFENQKFVGALDLHQNKIQNHQILQII